MMALSLPWLLCVLLLISIILLYKKKWIIAIVIIGSCFWVNWRAECIPFRAWPIKGQSVGIRLKVMTFNINGSSEDIEYRQSGIVRIIEETNPDIVFIAEYGDYKNVKLDSMLRKTFPYSTLTNYGAHYFYSKYPLTRQHLLPGKEDEDTGSYMTQICMGYDTVFVYGCHFASNNYTIDRHYMTPDSIRERRDLPTYYFNVQRAYERRSYEAEILIEDAKAHKGPFIVMGDLNDVGGSLCVRTLESIGLKDTWWEGGFGYGATIHKPLPYRIDHIMHTKKLKLHSVRVIDSKGLSDHDALYAEFELCNN